MTGLALALCLATWSSAGPLDLDVYAPPPKRPAAGRAAAELPRELWRPGSPLAMRGEGPGMQAFAHGAHATLGALGLAESLSRRDSMGPWHAAGFGAVALINAWLGFRALQPPPPEPANRPRR